MLALAADEQLSLRDELAQRDREMASLIEQQSREQELDLAAAQRALAIEIDALENEDDKDDLEVDFSALEKALAQGMGGGNSGARPL